MIVTFKIIHKVGPQNTFDFTFYWAYRFVNMYKKKDILEFGKTIKEEMKWQTGFGKVALKRDLVWRSSAVESIYIEFRDCCKCTVESVHFMLIQDVMWRLSFPIPEVMWKSDCPWKSDQDVQLLQVWIYCLIKA